MVVGAGIAGVACARELADAGIPVRVRERAHVPGGRLASRRFDGRPADIGAAYFTVSDPDFADVVERWRASGLAREWTDTFDAYGPDGRTSRPGPTRWAAPRGLRSLVEELATGLPVETDRLVTLVGAGPSVDLEPAGAVVLAMPGPQAARVLDPALESATRAALSQHWVPTLAAVLRYPERCWADFSGAFVNDHPMIATVCDDGERREDGQPVLVAHTTGGFARGYLAQPAAAAAAIERAVRDLLGLPVPAAETFVHRWTYAHPEPDGRPELPYHLDDDGIGLAGDAFGKPRVQTAWSSGRALGRALAERLGRPPSG